VYNYISGTNRLSHIQDYGSSCVFSFDYELKGNTTTKTGHVLPTNTLWLTYDRRNLSIVVQNLDMEFHIYRNENGLRVYRVALEPPKSTPLITTYREVAFYDYQLDNVQQVNLFGDGLEGKVNKEFNKTFKFFMLEDRRRNVPASDRAHNRLQTLQPGGGR